MPGEIAEIGERAVGAVQHPQLHVLVGRDVIDHLRPYRPPIGPVADEAVLDHPLPERFVDHGGFVVKAGQRLDPRDVFGLGRGRDPVDHRRREPALCGDPVGKAGIDLARQRHHDTAHDRAVGGEVVAGEHGEGRKPGGAAHLQRAHQEARRRDRQRRGDVVDNIRVGMVECAGGRFVAIALLGHREADDPGGRIGHQRQHRARVFARDQHLAHHLHPAGHVALGPELERDVGPALRRQRVAHMGRLQRHAGDAPVAPRGIGRGGDGLLGVDRAVRPEEGTEAKVDDASTRRRRGAGQAFSGQASLHRH